MGGNDNSSDWKADSEYISDTRFKFSFATDEGTLFCEISVPMKAGDTVPDELRQRAAVAKPKRLLEGIGTALKDLD